MDPDAGRIATDGCFTTYGTLSDAVEVTLAPRPPLESRDHLHPLFPPLYFLHPDGNSQGGVSHGPAGDAARLANAAVIGTRRLHLSGGRVDGDDL